MKKALSTTACSLISALIAQPINAANSYSLYEKSFQITENLHYYEHLLTRGQIQEIDNLLNRINFVYNLPSEKCGNPDTVYQEAYHWAYSSKGLNYLSSKAQDFAERISQKMCPSLYLDTFKMSYDFGYGSSGLNKVKSSAVEFAYMITDYEQLHYYPLTALACFKEKFDFAYSTGGLNKTKSQAEAYAKDKCLIN